jgi:YbbR domain-containing protein
MSVPIQYTNLPLGMEITGKWMDKIDVRLRGPESGLANLKPGAVRAVIDLNGVLPGLNFYRMTSKNIQVPVGVAISQIRPSDLTLHIETALHRKMPVVPHVLGNLPERAVLAVSPPEVRVRAVQDVLKKIGSVTTDPITVSDLLSKGKINVTVLLRPEGLKIESIDPLDVTVSLRQEQP